MNIIIIFNNANKQILKIYSKIDTLFNTFSLNKNNNNIFFYFTLIFKKRENKFKKYHIINGINLKFNSY